ncbi:histidine kinase [Mucilaginibacter sp. RS28]|uniref:histidine kinase n=1 Tax=Mucilaginibacter straminoryzae TaxID=2932774 RepID=A0A9X2BAT6_9SPHI|nr:ATP-binding protein [Mucilaginibacter straminoryzae]MCJ8211756.1 histidine kinase [Mucilaginibacter straminoryzae]
MRKEGLDINNDIITVVFIACLFFALIVSFLIFFVVLYNRRQARNRREKADLQSHYKQELLKTQIEVQDQTLSYISREIHDNITQVLSFVKLSLGVKTADPEQNRAKINESRELLAQAINDLRDLSKSLSFDSIKAMGLTNTLEREIKRINNSGLITVTLQVDGEAYTLGEKRELVIFRIFQESVNNALKHANAKQMKVELLYSEKVFNLTISDNGEGFDTRILNDFEGSGLNNMLNRAKLIGAKANIESAVGKGCRISLTLDEVIQQIYADGTY